MMDRYIAAQFAKVFTDATEISVAFSLDGETTVVHIAGHVFTCTPTSDDDAFVFTSPDHEPVVFDFELETGVVGYRHEDGKVEWLPGHEPFPSARIKAALASNDPAKVKEFLNLTAVDSEQQALLDQCAELYQSR